MIGFDFDALNTQPAFACRHAPAFAVQQSDPHRFRDERAWQVFEYDPIYAWLQLGPAHARDLRLIGIQLHVLNREGMRVGSRPGCVAAGGGQHGGCQGDEQR